MNHKFKNIDIKYLTYYFFNDIINIKNLVPNKIETNKKSCKKKSY